MLLCFSTCTKKEDPDGKPNPAGTAITATLDQNSVSPGQVVTLTVSADLPAQEGWDILVGGRKLRAVRLDARRACFLVPTLAPGPISLELSTMGIKAAPALTMNSYTPITDAAAVLTAFDGRMTKAIAQFEALSKDTLSPVAAQDVASVRSLQKTLAAQWQTLTPAEQIEAAYVLQKMTFQEITIPQRRGVAGITSADPGNDFTAIGKAFVTTMAFTAASIDAFFVFAASPDPVSKLGAVAAAAVGIVSVGSSFKLIDELCRRFDLIVDLKLFALGGSSTLTLAQDQGTPAAIDATGRTLAASDAGKSSLLTSIVKANEKLGSLHEAFVKTFERIKAWLGSANPPSTYINPVKAAAATGKRKLSAELVRIQNVSNTAITLASSVVNNALNLKASSPTIKTDTPFTFDVVYENAELGINVRRTLNATFTNPDSIAYYSKLVQGNWVTTWHAYGSFHQEDVIVLQANGQGKRLSVRTPTRSEDYTSKWGSDPFYDITWSVYKSGNAYYLRFHDNRWTTSVQYGRITPSKLEFKLDHGWAYTLNKKQ
ncbi:hypothetical protein ASU33_19645 [Solirubrum puertoriconensis]|uniref:Uncharacterized protein n=2 Tax=Solirubrum puertoriconensis TaxID=1751427 RepID=A0A9X0HN12_SOLP1|nr:hypothetical protein ASU33_19645 [Solirubrum puertoriconensis]